MSESELNSLIASKGLKSKYFVKRVEDPMMGSLFKLYERWDAERKTLKIQVYESAADELVRYIENLK